MQARIEEGYATRAIALSGNEIWRVPDYNTVILTPTTVASGTFKVYGSPDYDSRNEAHVADPTLATWVPLPSTNLVGAEVAADSVITPVAGRSIVFSCAGFPHVRAVEQGAGTASLLCRASTFGITDVLGVVTALIGVDTELPAARLAANNLAYPTAPDVLATLMLNDGATLDMAPGNSADGMLVNLGANNDVSLTAPAAGGGLSLFYSADLDETEEEVKATAGAIYFIRYANRSAAEVFIKFYNATAANVTVGTTAPVDVWSLKAGERGHVAIPHGWAFSTAITVAATTDLAEDGSPGAPAANDVMLSLRYA